jgi:hypothetical protein
MHMPRAIAEVLDKHVTFELEGIERMYLTGSEARELRSGTAHVIPPAWKGATPCARPSTASWRGSTTLSPLHNALSKT